MTYIPRSDFALEVALGNVTGYTKINKFGASPDVDTHITDIWGGADGTTSTDVWVAPTQARIHAIVSADDEDGGAGTDTGMLTCQVYGLTDWDTKESSETVTLNGTTPVNTVGSYVIIHRMKGLTWGSTKNNIGIIKATAATDNTITAIIGATENQTKMAIYGIPSTQTMQVSRITGIITSAPGASVISATGDLLVQENVDVATSAFVSKEDFEFTDERVLDRRYDIYKSFTGPCIVKLQMTASANDKRIIGAFDAFVVDN